MTIEQLAQRLVQFESTHENPKEMQACLDFCVSFFSGYPVIVKRYEHEGIHCVVIETKDTLQVDVLLLGHIDTLTGSKELFLGKIQDGKLYGRATLDMKAFVATSLMVMKELLDEGYTGNIALAIVTDEEMGGKHGARYLVEEIGYKANVVLVPDDGEKIHRMVVESKHIFHLEFFAEGTESHAARPWMGDNAILKLYTTYQKLAEHFPSFTEPPKDIWVNTINLGTIQGGIATNEVPGSATMGVDVRVTPVVTREEVVGWIESALAPGVSYIIGMEGYPTIVNTQDSLVQKYMHIIQEVTGISVECIKNGGGTDGRYFSHAGMRVIVHQGNGGLCQTDNEHVELASLQQLVAIQKRFIRENF